MSSHEAIQNNFREKVSSKVHLASEGVGRFRVLTPFRFDDGDHLAIVLRQEGNNWVLSDEAHTYMHLTYDMNEQDFQKGTRQQIISNALSVFNVEDRNGELVMNVPSEQYGDALFSFVQALLKVTDVTFLSRDRARSTFKEDFKSVFSTLPEDRRTFDWFDRDHDPDGIYTVDCRINGMSQPLFVHALANDADTRDTTIALLEFERWAIPFRSLAIFENQETINRKVLARFTNVSDRQFASLSGNIARIERFLKEVIPPEELTFDVRLGPRSVLEH